MKRGIIVAVLHCCLVLTLAAKYAIDRERLPRVWVQASPLDPNMPIRGRYVSLALTVEADAPTTAGIAWTPVRLRVQDGRLIAERSQADTGIDIQRRGPGWVIAEPVPFFIPEHIADPSRPVPGEELWVEVSVPPSGLPRPLRLGRKQH